MPVHISAFLYNSVHLQTTHTLVTFCHAVFYLIGLITGLAAALLAYSFAYAHSRVDKSQNRQSNNQLLLC